MKLGLACDFRRRLRGLKARGLGRDVLLLIAPCSSVHSFGMRGPMDAAFVDDAGRVLDVRCGMGPGEFFSCSRAYACLERYSPTGDGERDLEPWFQVGDRLDLAAWNHAWQVS